MTDFKIRRGLSSTLFIAPDVVNPRILIEEGCWYLCTDTAELYLGVFNTDQDKLDLCKINGSHGMNEPDLSGGTGNAQLESQIKDLEARLDVLDSFKLYQRIESEFDLPTDFNSSDFDPNITYYISLGNNKISTYVFDTEAQGYMCTNSLDETIVRAMISDALEFVFDDKFTEKTQQVIKQTLGATILYGGDASNNIVNG